VIVLDASSIASGGSTAGGMFDDEDGGDGDTGDNTSEDSNGDSQ
jgi:hypothetical protein